jgi:hypothetical protein
MVKGTPALLDKSEIVASDTGMEMVAAVPGFAIYPPPYVDAGDEKFLPFTVMDEEFIYTMGCTPGSLQAAISNGAGEFCNKIISEIAFPDRRTSFNDLQNQAAIYLIGYQEDLRAS